MPHSAPRTPHVTEGERIAVVEVELRRGAVVESRHRVHVAVDDGEGALVAQAGHPQLVTFWRSAAKPFQATPLDDNGVPQHFNLKSEDPRVIYASHPSEP